MRPGQGRGEGVAGGAPPIITGPEESVCKLLVTTGKGKEKVFLEAETPGENIVLCEIDKQRSCLFPWWREARL